MNRRPHIALRYLLLLLLAVACWYLLMSALDMPMLELQANTLSTLRATVMILFLAVCTYLLYLPHLRITVTDLLAAMLFIVVTINRLFLSGPAGAVRYDELLQIVMLYISLRVLFTAEPRTITLLLMLLCIFGIYEAWIGMRQVFGFAYSNHSLFKVTGTFFNPGPYAGFIAPIFICAVACIVRTRRITTHVSNSLLGLYQQRPAILWTVGTYYLSWCAALMTVVVLPAAMSRAGMIAVLAGGGMILLRETSLLKRYRVVYSLNPLKTSVLTALIVLLACSIGAGCYYLKRPSADGRLLMWKIDSRIMLNNPLCGVGLGNFAGAFGDEQATYFSSKERSDTLKQVAGCPESGFNEFLQFGAETGIGGFVLLLLVTGTAIVSMVRRGKPFGYGLLTATAFACFSYPWGVLPLRLLFIILLTGSSKEQTTRLKCRPQHCVNILLLTGCLVCWPRLYERYNTRVNARKSWSEVRVWMDAEHYDYLVEDGAKLYSSLKGDFRFLYDYGYSLHKTGNYKKSNEILLQGMEISSDPIFWCIAGKNYEAEGDFKAAEEVYRHAHYMIPNRVYPLYLLAKLYYKTGQTGKAHTIAQQAISFIPKVESVQTKEMQEEMKDLLITK